jgi:TolB-like protein
MGANAMALDPGTTLGPFRISGLLGAGGMGEVYRAHDSRLGREVAVKVLPEAFAGDADRLARFEREARTLASLDHPGIAAIHDLQEDDGVRFLVMQLVEGETLAEKLRSGPLELDVALPLFRQVADALDYAHQRGIVHRDLKPANVKIAPDGRARILDFGLARAFGDRPDAGGDPADAPTVGPDDSARTSAGQVLGTPAYMSPEQARGQEVDKRTDVWAFGCCLYEALCGRRPFEGRSSSDVIAEILKSEPDWTRIPGDTPPYIVLLLRRCLEKDPRRRLSSMGDLAITFEETTSGLRRRSAADEVVVSGEAGGRRRRLGIGSALVAGALVLAGILYIVFREQGSTATTIERIAVLPFSDDSDEVDRNWFADGMTAALVNELARIDALTVISRTSAMQYRNPTLPVREIAVRLGADALVEGSVTRAGDDVRITASLIEGATERVLWSQGYDGSLDDVLNLQGRIAVAIAGEIDVALTPEERAELERDRNVDPRALDAYLRGVHELSRQTGAGRERAIAHFREAIRIEPGYALAYARLSMALVSQFVWGFATREEVSAAAAEADRTALELDPGLALGWAAKADRVITLDWDWAPAETYYTRALEADPDDAAAVYAYAFGLALYTDRHEEAVRLGRRAVELEPSVLLYQADLAEIMLPMKRFEEAAEHLDRVNSVDPDFVPALVLRAYLGILSGQHELAIRSALEALEVSGDRRHLEYLGTAYALAGREAEARAVLVEFEELARSEFIQRAEIGMILLALEERDRAYELFRESLRNREYKLLWLESTGFFDVVEVDARLAELLERVRANQGSDG